MKKVPFLLFLVSLALSLKAQDKVRFMLFSDLHYDLVPDGDKRLQTICNQAQKHNVDFMLEMGDFIPSVPEFEKVRKQVQAFPIPLYHTLGNHDIDRNDKQTYVDFWQMPARYYSFDHGLFRFIVLDSDFFENEKGEIVAYDKGNYYQYPEEKRNRFDAGQLEWLKKTLADSAPICILFVHGPINDGYSRIINNGEIHAILTEAQRNGTRIAGVFGGHIHSDNYHRIDGLHYLQMNSASYIWGGTLFTNTERYKAEDYKKYPSLKYTIPYEDALYAIVEINSNGKVTIKGSKSKYIKPAPEPEKLKTKEYPCSPVIKNRKWKYQIPGVNLNSN